VRQAPQEEPPPTGTDMRWPVPGRSLSFAKGPRTCRQSSRCGRESSTCGRRSSRRSSVCRDARLAVAVVTNPPPPSDPEPPALTPETVEDEEALAEAVDQFVRRDVEARERLSDTNVYVEALRSAVEPDVWTTALRIDELTTARWTDLAVGVARWAFTEGQRSPCEPEAPHPDHNR
jgi:hypothetical protein